MGPNSLIAQIYLRAVDFLFSIGILISHQGRHRVPASLTDDTFAVMVNSRMEDNNVNICHFNKSVPAETEERYTGNQGS
jgi:hypothetical protein